MLLTEESKDAIQQMDNMKDGISDRRQKAMYIKDAKAIKTAFDEYSSARDVNQLLRFACHREELQALSDTSSDSSTDEEVCRSYSYDLHIKLFLGSEKISSP